MNRLVLWIEGADKVGKTSLIKALKEKYSCKVLDKYEHSDKQSDYVSQHRNNIDQASLLLAFETDIVIIDRSYLTTYVEQIIAEDTDRLENSLQIASDIEKFFTTKGIEHHTIILTGKQREKDDKLSYSERQLRATIYNNPVVEIVTSWKYTRVTNNGTKKELVNKVSKIIDLLRRSK